MAKLIIDMGTSLIYQNKTQTQVLSTYLVATRDVNLVHCVEKEMMGSIIVLVPRAEMVLPVKI